jgi:transposase InsO family protein
LKASPYPTDASEQSKNQHALLTSPVDWFNNRRLLEPIGYIPPAEAEERYYAQFNTLDMVA